MATVSGTARSSIAFSLTGAGWLAGQATAIAPPTNPQNTFTNGTAAGQGDLVYAATITLSAAPQTLDLTSLLDPLNGAVAFARVRVFYLCNKATTDGWVVTLGNDGTNEWSGASQFLSASGTLKIGPTLAGTANAGRFEIWSPNTTGYVVDSTHKRLKIDPGAHSFDVEIMIVGASV
jgi:hypothetical protein